MLRRLVSAVRQRLGGTIDASNEYLNWLCFANAGMQQRGNLHSFDMAIRRLPPVWRC